MKPFYYSKTFWVNFLTLAGGILSILLASDQVKENPELVSILGMIVLPIVNLFLRWLTEEPITSIARVLDRVPGRRGVVRRSEDLGRILSGTVDREREINELLREKLERLKAGDV